MTSEASIFFFKENSEREKIDENKSISPEIEKYKRGFLQVSSLYDVASFVRYIQNMEIIILVFGSSADALCESPGVRAGYSPPSSCLTLRTGKVA